MSFKISVNMSLVIIFKIFCFWTCNFWQCWTFINLFSNCVNNIISYITITLFKFSTLSSALIFVLFIKLVKDVFFLISSNFYSSSKFNIKIFPSLSELVMTNLFWVNSFFNVIFISLFKLFFNIKFCLIFSFQSSTFLSVSFV